MVQSILCDITSGAGAKRRNRAFIPWMREETENTDGRIEFPHFPNRSDSIHSREIKVHQHYLRSVFAKQQDGLLRRSRDPDEFHIRL